MIHRTSVGAFVVAAIVGGCGGATESSAPMTEPPPPSAPSPETSEAPPPGSFADDLAFLHEHLPELVVLSQGSARIAVAPEYQGRVMTSAAAPDRASHGWINRELIASGERKPHMNAFGGEDRFWLGPEGGQYALYFEPGASFDLEHWQVPEPIDWGPWETVERTESEVRFRRDMELVNHSGTELSIRAERVVRILAPAEAASELGVPEDAPVVAYESVNTIENTGDEPWDPETGLVSIWILSMYRPSPATTVVIPFRPGPEQQLGPPVNDAYFGEVPDDRLVVDAEDGVLFFRADGRQRGKIGISHRRAKPVMGSWDADGGVLTLVQYTLPEQAPHGYVNSMWEQQEAPYGGDVVNSYNDGPAEPGAEPLGPFYELESSSPAAALAPGERLEHVHRTYHVEGPRETLDRVAREELGVGLDRIEAALPR